MTKIQKLQLSAILATSKKDESMKKIGSGESFAVNIKFNVYLSLENSEMNPFKCNFSNMR